MNTEEDRERGRQVQRERADQRAAWVIDLYDNGGASLDEMAAKLQVHRDSVRTVIYRARKRLAR